MNEKEIPRFRSEDEEREFWAKHDTTDYVDWSRARRGKFPHLRPTDRSVLTKDKDIPADGE